MPIKIPAAELYMEEDGHWILDTHLRGLGAIRRFYLGLADKMEKLRTKNSEALIKEISAYIANSIQ